MPTGRADDEKGRTMQMICENVMSYKCRDCTGMDHECANFNPVEMKKPEEPKMRLNTIEEQCELIRAEAAGKKIEMWISGDAWTDKANPEGLWNFTQLHYRIAPDEPAKPQVEEYEIVKDSGGHYVFFDKSCDEEYCISQAVDRGFAFVHDHPNGHEILSAFPIMWHDIASLWDHQHNDDVKPIMARKVRRVL